MQRSFDAAEATQVHLKDLEELSCARLLDFCVGIVSRLEGSNVAILMNGVLLARFPVPGPFSNPASFLYPAPYIPVA
jgi:hypothetical protein